MLNWLRKKYRAIAEKGSGPKHTIFVNGTLTAAGLYLPIKRATGFSLSAWVNTIFHAQASSYIVYFLVMILVYSSLAKLFLLAVEVWPASPVTKVEPEGLAMCMLKINQEIEKHMEMINNGTNHVLPSLLNAHSFDLNVRLVVQSLAEHIVACVKSKKFRKRDIFISVYQIPEFHEKNNTREKLIYMTHCPENRDNVTTKDIDLLGENHGDFYCVRCIREGQTCFIRKNCSDYAKGKGKRKKFIKHYIGFALKANDMLLGFVNIEFHENCFDSDEDLESFAETNLMAYKFLIEYQFLKRAFFRTVHSQVQTKVG